MPEGGGTLVCEPLEAVLQALLYSVRREQRKTTKEASGHSLPHELLLVLFGISAPATRWAERRCALWLDNQRTRWQAREWSEKMRFYEKRSAMNLWGLINVWHSCSCSCYSKVTGVRW